MADFPTLNYCNSSKTQGIWPTFWKALVTIYHLTISSPKFGTAVFFILILPTLPSYSNALLLCCDDTKDLSIEFVTCSKQIEQTIIFFYWNTVFQSFFN